MTMQGVRTIDMSQPWPEFCQAFGDAFRDIGFAVVTNHGIDPALFHKMYAILARAFALPDDVKRKYEIPEHTSGFVPFRTEHAKDSPTPDEKEIWETRFRGVFYRDSQFPAEIPEFQTTAGELYNALDGCSLRLLQALDEYLQPPHQRMYDMAVGGDSLFRLLHYPALKGDEPGIRSFRHTDINFITLLPAATRAGLQVMTKSGAWLDVVNPPDAIIVNAGDMLQAFSEHIGKRIPSTEHQVANIPDERFSMPFFGHPRGEVELRPGLTAGAYLYQRLVEIGLIKP